MAPFFCLILLAAYIRDYILLFIAINMVTNLAVWKMPCFRKYLYFDLVHIYGKDYLKQGKKESDLVFIIAFYTSWISPFTVWHNDRRFKSQFLIVSSLTTLLCNLTGTKTVPKSLWQ